jgi:hypothetical protein
MLDVFSRYDFHVLDFGSVQVIMSFMLETLSNGQNPVNTFVWLLCTISITLFCVPSKADFQHCRSGVLTLLGMFVASALLFKESFASMVSILSGSLMVIVWPVYLCLFVSLVLWLVVLAIKSAKAWHSGSEQV